MESLFPEDVPLDLNWILNTFVLLETVVKALLVLFYKNKNEQLV